MVPLGDASPGTYLPLAVGALVAGVACLVVLSRSDLSDSGATEDPPPGRRQLAFRIVTLVYVVLALCFMAASIIVGGTGFVVTAGILLFLSVAACVALWSPSG